MKSLLGEEHSFIIESDDDDDDDDEEDPTHGDAGAADEDDGSSSDSSSSCATPRAGGGDGSHPNSYTNEWPQSYRLSGELLIRFNNGFSFSLWSSGRIWLLDATGC